MIIKDEKYWQDKAAEGYRAMPRAETEFERYIKEMPRAELGGLLKEYIAETNYQGWEFSSRDMSGIRNFLADLQRYHTWVAKEGDAKALAIKITNVNPVP